MTEWQPIEAAPDGLFDVVAGIYTLTGHWSIFNLHRLGNGEYWCGDDCEVYFAGDRDLFYLSNLPTPPPRPAPPT